MKKLLFLLAAATMFAFTANAQYDPISVHNKYLGFDTTANTGTLLTQFAAKSNYVPLALQTGNIQTISAHYDTVTGKLLTVITASRLDTVKLKKANYTTGQIFHLLCTASSNDSTKIIPDAGNINGASTYWFTGTYKAATLYFDGTNYWLLNKQ